MKRVIIESPFAGRSTSRWKIIAFFERLWDERQNVRYAKACLLDSLKRGEAPFASHLIYTQVLDDRDPHQRSWGIEAGIMWGVVASLRVVYTDRGVSKGMEYGIAAAKRIGQPIEYRSISSWKKRKKLPTLVAA